MRAILPLQLMMLMSLTWNVELLVSGSGAIVRNGLVVTVMKFYKYLNILLENILVDAHVPKGLECPVFKLVNSGTSPRLTA